MATISFTNEHLSKLKQAATEMLFQDRKVKGQIGTELSIHDLLHIASVSTLQTLHGNLKKTIDSKENLDEWSMTEYQQKQLVTLKKDKEVINLIIGYRKSLAEREANSQKLAKVREQIKDIKEQTLTPEARLQALTEKEKELSVLSEEFTEEVKTLQEEIKNN